MSNKKFRKLRIMSILIGIIAGGWIGWIIGTVLVNYGKSFAYSFPILIIALATLVGLLGAFYLEPQSF